MLKNVLLSLLALSVAQITSAGTMGEVIPHSKNEVVTIPCPSRGWELAVEGLYLKPVFSAHSFLPNVTGGFREADPDWDWGYRLEGTYHFNMGNDLTVKWLHYNTNSNLGTFAGSYVQLLPPVGAIVVGAPFTSNLNNRLEQANVLFGQHVDFSPLQSGRFYAGLQYSVVQLDTTNNFQVPALFAAIGGARTDNNTDFKGFGPTVGIDYNYNMAPGFSLLANASTSLLFGSTRLDNSTIYGNGLIASSAYLNKKVVVPEVEAKLGISYTYPVAAYGALALEGGYQVLQYFNVLQTLTSTSSAAIATNDFGLYGPYIKAKWVGWA